VGIPFRFLDIWREVNMIPVQLRVPHSIVQIE
jgi:hypothetical protein